MNASESLLYLPLNMRNGTQEVKAYAPMLPSVALTDEGLSAYVLTRTLGALQQGLYVLSGGLWQFTMPQPILSDILIKGSVVSVYLGLATPLTVSPSSVVFKNGILFEPRVLEGGAVFCVLSPDGQGETSVFLKAAQNLSGHRAVKATPAGADYASCDVADDANSLIGITTGAAVGGELAKIQTDGELSEPSWSWIVGKPLFCGLNGMLTQTSPVAGYSLIVGIAIEPSSILISVKQPIVLN